MAEENNLNSDEKIVNKAISESQKEILNEFKKGTIDLKKAIHELTNVTKNDILGTKQRINDLKSLNEAIKQNTTIQKQALEQTKKSDSITSKAKQEDNVLTNQYILQRRYSAVGSIAEGRIYSGARDLFSTFKLGEKILKSRWFLALELGARLLLKFDDHLSKVTKTMASVTGGLTSEFVGNRFSAAQQRGVLRESLRDIGQQNKIDDILGAISSSYGQAYAKTNINDLVKTSGYARYGLGSFGISEQSSQNLISNLQLIEGKTSTGVTAQLKRLTDRFATMTMFSPEQALQQATSLYDQTKHLGTNFEWASKAIQKFEVGLKNGTITLNDFAAVNRALRGGGISKNAGIAAMVTDYAYRTGMNLPSEFLNSDIMGQGFAISTRAMLKDSRFAKAYQGAIQEQLDQMGGATRTDKAARLQYLLSQIGVNIGPEAAENAIKSNGKIDLISSNIIGTGAFKKEEDERREAEEYNKMVKDYYKGTETYYSQMKTWVGGLYQHFVGNSFREGQAQGMSTSSMDFFRNFGALFGPQFYKDLWDAAYSHTDTNLYPTKVEITVGHPGQTSSSN